jgi:predicted nucleic acid-binding Zn ribbon protein
MKLLPRLLRSISQNDRTSFNENEIMSAAKLEIQWLDKTDETRVPMNQSAVEAGPPVAPILSRHLAKPTAGNRCPHCQSIIYSRKAKLCGVCSQPIPNELRFSEDEARRVQSILETERNRHRQWVSRGLQETLAVI